MPSPKPEIQKAYFNEDGLNDDLVQIATDFARSYSGDFSYLCTVRDRLVDEPLTPALAKSVLNIMRNDPNGRELLPAASLPRIPPPQAAVLSLVPQARVSEPKITKRAYNKTPKTPVPQAIINSPRRDGLVPIKATWKLRWLYSTHASANVAHLVDVDKSQAFVDWESNVFVYNIECTCRRPRYPSNFLRLADAAPEGYSECRRCLEMDSRPTRRRSPS